MTPEALLNSTLAPYPLGTRTSTFASASASWACPPAAPGTPSSPGTASSRIGSTRRGTRCTRRRGHRYGGAWEAGWGRGCCSPVRTACLCACLPAWLPTAPHPLPLLLSLSVPLTREVLARERQRTGSVARVLPVGGRQPSPPPATAPAAATTGAAASRSPTAAPALSSDAVRACGSAWVGTAAFFAQQAQLVAEARASAARARDVRRGVAPKDGGSAEAGASAAAAAVTTAAAAAATAATPAAATTPAPDSGATEAHRPTASTPSPARDGAHTGGDAAPSRRPRRQAAAAASVALSRMATGNGGGDHRASTGLTSERKRPSSAGRAGGRAPPVPVEYWVCERCTLLNGIASEACMACEGQRPASLGPMVSESEEEEEEEADAFERTSKRRRHATLPMR